MPNCLHCHAETDNTKFCRRLCFDNYYKEKRIESKGKCHICETPIHSKKRYCEQCKFKPIDWSTVTIEQVQKQHKHQHYNRIREVARRIYKDQCIEGISPCQSCGYLKHVEVCHIKPISDYPKDTTVTELNKPENIAILCCNCHWELDNGYLQYKDGKFSPSTPQKKIKTLMCQTCNKPFTQRHKPQKYCSRPCSPRKRYVERPSKEVLEDLIKIKKTPWIHIGKQYGVTDNSVRKWAKYYSII